MTTVAEIDAWLEADEDEHLEFKEAQFQLDFQTLLEYCIALANERGGKLVLGVTDRRPRRVVGSSAFPAIAKTTASIHDSLHMRVDVEELQHPDGRLVIFHVPQRPLGAPLQHRGRYLMRSGQQLVAMTQEQLQAIFAEAIGDFTGEICHGATPADLDPDAIERFRASWIRKSGNEDLRALDPNHLLSDAGLIVDGSITVAAVILLGSDRALDRHLPQAEVIFEWRQRATIAYDDRRELRRGAFLFLDELWELVNLRNTRQHFRDGLFVLDIATFNELAVREAILNAVTHRDYRAAGSVFVRQFGERIEIESPGGFPIGVTADNVLFRQVPRNRLLAETLAKTGLVERSGQGVDRMFETAIREGKPLPDFSQSDPYHVLVSLDGTIQDPAFLRFLERVADEGTYSFATADLFVLDHVRHGQPVPPELQARLHRLVENDIVERFGRGRGVKYILSRRFAAFLGDPASYTRERGLDRATNKELLVRHIVLQGTVGCSLSEVAQVLPQLTTEQVRTLLKELKQEQRVHSVGKTRSARWFPGTALKPNH
ncbi:MAG TPA: ATP-binding protein [Thermoanaerobaculia bacterium]|jgi:ATP-dependent DNA helicase RecG